MNRIHVDGTIGGRYSFPVSNITIEILHRAYHAVWMESCSRPEYHIVGLKTWFELTVMMGGWLAMLGKVVVDTSREHYFAAVADPDWQIGRPLPAGSVWAWTQDCGWVPNE